ncbi:MAG TPA: hypothetical protein VHB73_06680, partial [Alphaproteobacteria bacterium]|nr:hypothetical protein [Alphaproteobacteria bacterium]
LSPLATNAFADPDSGLTGGLRLAAALNDNSTGHFNLVSGLTIAGSAVGAALSAVNDIQSTLNDIRGNVSVLSDSTASSDEVEDNRTKLQLNLQKIKDLISSADIGGFNLIDDSNSSGVTLDLNSGEFANTGTTAPASLSNTDARFAFDPNKISFQTPDLNAAFDDLNNLQLQTFPGTDANLDSQNNFYTVDVFQSRLSQASSSLSALKKSLTAAAMEKLTVNYDPSAGSVNDGADARQIASRLATQLSNDSFNVTANPAIRFFSLFA